MLSHVLAGRGGDANEDAEEAPTARLCALSPEDSENFHAPAIYYVLTSTS